MSQTGAFIDTAHLVPSAGLIPYDLIVPFWSDGAVKTRYMAIPQGTRIGFNPDGDWTFPAGAVFVKTFELPTDEAHPGSDGGSRHGCWCAMTGAASTAWSKMACDNSDADLLPGAGADRTDPDPGP